MADLLVSMGIDDRGVRRGLQTVEAAVNRSQTRMAGNGMFGTDFLRTEKGLNKIGASLSGLPLKLGAVGSAFYAFKNGAEYLREFEEQLPRAERGIDRMIGAYGRFKKSWAIDMETGAGGGATGFFSRFIDDASRFREDATDLGNELMIEMFGTEALDLAKGDTPQKARAAKKADLESIAQFRQNQELRARRLALDAQIVGAREDQRAAAIASAEARMAQDELALMNRVNSKEGIGQHELKFERTAIRARYDADVEKANREQKKREEDEAERKAQDERKRIDEQNKRIARASEDQMQIEGDRVRRMERLAETADQKRDAREARIWLDAEERIRGYRKRLREGDLDKAGFNALLSSTLSLELTEYKASDDEYAKAVGDAERATRAKRDGASIDAQELKAQTAAAMARTKEEKKVAKELELQAKFRRDEAMIRAQGLDAESERSLLEERRRLLDAEVGAVGQEGRSPRDSAGFGMDLSSAGAAASVGQAFAYSIPGKIDTTNQLIRQSNQTLREIKDKVDGAARFGP